MFLIACRLAARANFLGKELRVVNQVLTEWLFKSHDRLQLVFFEAWDWKPLIDGSLMTGKISEHEIVQR